MSIPFPHASLLYECKQETSAAQVPKGIRPLHRGRIDLARAGHPARIAFRAGTSGEARVEVFDVRGRGIRSLARMHVTPGRHVIDWDLSDDHQSAIARGLYFVRLQLDGEHVVRKVVIASR